MVDFLIAAVAVAAVVFAIFKKVKNYKNSKNGYPCSFDCSSCDKQCVQKYFSCSAEKE